MGEDLTTLITPNTELMDYIENEIESELKLIEKTSKIQCIFSSSKVPGEGETKILNHINNSDSFDSNFVISSPDNDVTAAVLAVNKQNVIVTSDVRFKEDDIFHKGLFIEHYLPKTEVGRKCLDISLLMLSKGNDYLPVLCGTHEHFDKLYSRYITLQKHIIKVEDKKIYLDLEVFCQVFENLSDKFYRKMKLQKVENYLKSLIWNLQMYMTGICPDYSYLVSSYIHSKLIHELAAYNKENNISNTYIFDIQDPIPHPMTPITYSLSILPTPAQIYLGIEKKIEIWKSPNENIKFKPFEIGIESKMEQSFIVGENSRTHYQEEMKSFTLLSEFNPKIRVTVFTNLIRCSYFQKKGFCNNEYCTFDHTPEECKYFLLGKCKNRYCKFLHPRKPFYEELLEISRKSKNQHYRD